MLILRQKIFLILYPPFENSTTSIAIVYIACNTMENHPLISNEFIQEANLWSQSQREETFMMTLRNIQNNMPYLFGYLVVTAWNLIEALIENGIDDYQVFSLALTLILELITGFFLIFKLSNVGPMVFLPNFLFYVLILLNIVFVIVRAER